MGLAQPLPTLVNFAEQQARWVADYLAGGYALPSVAEMGKTIAEDEGRDIGHYYSSRRHTMNSSTGTGDRSFSGFSLTSAIFRLAAASGTIATPSPARTMARIEWIWLRCWT